MSEMKTIKVLKETYIDKFNRKIDEIKEKIKELKETAKEIKVLKAQAEIYREIAISLSSAKEWVL